MLENKYVNLVLGENGGLKKQAYPTELRLPT
jgi:hypothetical protein